MKTTFRLNQNDYKILELHIYLEIDIKKIQNIQIKFFKI